MINNKESRLGSEKADFHAMFLDTGIKKISPDTNELINTLNELMWIVTSYSANTLSLVLWFVIDSPLERIVLQNSTLQSCQQMYAQKVDKTS